MLSNDVCVRYERCRGTPQKVARAKALGGFYAQSTSSSSSPPSSSRNGRGGGGGGGRGAGDRRGHDKVAFAVGLLDIALPRDDRPGGSFPRVMVNDACITRAVQGEAASPSARCQVQCDICSYDMYIIHRHQHIPCLYYCVRLNVARIYCCCSCRYLISHRLIAIRPGLYSTQSSTSSQPSFFFLHFLSLTRGHEKEQKQFDRKTKPNQTQSGLEKGTR